MEEHPAALQDQDAQPLQETGGCMEENNARGYQKVAGKKTTLEVTER